MTDAALVGRLLDEYHERFVAPANIKVLAGSVDEIRVSYQLTLPDGSAQVVRAFRADAPVPAEARGLTAVPMADWLLDRARTLARLQEMAYPAPRPVLTRSGELIGVAGQWLSWATSFVQGRVIAPTTAQLRQLGESLGALHSLPAGGIGLAPRHPVLAGPVALARLDAVASLAPDSWRGMLAAFRSTINAVLEGAGAAAEAIVHGDPWTRNAVQRRDGSLTLIDWEMGGRGLAVVDLAHCLVETHLDAGARADQPEAWLISPDEARINAVASGYASVRQLTAPERELLAASARFPAAIIGAVQFEAALIGGASGPSIEARLACLENRLAVADAIAAAALRYL
ncbi:MAG: phosphotransferase enzyme family protein [Streptosporangiaceae bacterium]